ncbi:hypothetical protein AB9K34_07620 [Sedimentitalea sp. XS_ASV28]
MGDADDRMMGRFGLMRNALILHAATLSKVPEYEKKVLIRQAMFPA